MCASMAFVCVYVYVWGIRLCTWVFGECSKLFIFIRIFRYFISNASFNSFSPSITICTRIEKIMEKMCAIQSKQTHKPTVEQQWKKKLEKNGCTLTKHIIVIAKKRIIFVPFNNILIFSFWTFNVFVVRGQT